MTNQIYIAGPMSGYPNFNFNAFSRASAYMEAMGFIIFNPAAKDIERHGGVDISKDNPTGSVELAAKEHGFSLRDALRDDTKWICENATHMYMLRGWENSKGAKMEHALAIALGLTILYEN